MDKAFHRVVTKVEVPKIHLLQILIAESLVPESSQRIVGLGHDLESLVVYVTDAS